MAKPLLKTQTATATSSPKRPFSVLRGVDLRAILHTYKEQRAAGQFPYAAFTHAAEELEWIPATEEPTAEPIAPFLTVGEIKQLTSKFIIEIAHGELPANSYAAHHLLTEEEVDARAHAAHAILKRNGAKANVEDLKEWKRQKVRPFVMNVALSRRHEKEIKNLKRRRLPYTHPLSGIKVPLVLSHSVSDSPESRYYPYRGILIQNTGVRSPYRDDWQCWTGLKGSNCEKLPDITDMPWVIQQHEIGHVVQGDASDLRGKSIHFESDYRIEGNAELFALESYRRYGADRARIELMYARLTVQQYLCPNTHGNFDERVYWGIPALMLGQKGFEAWPLYRISTAVTELHHAAAGMIYNVPLHYKPSTLHELIKESYLRLQETPPQKGSYSFTYRHLYKTFNFVAQHYANDASHSETVATFNLLADAHRHLIRRPSKKWLRARLMSAFRELWLSDRPMHPDTLLVLGLTLEAAALFKPSLRHKPPVTGPRPNYKPKPFARPSAS